MRAALLAVSLAAPLGAQGVTLVDDDGTLARVLADAGRFEVGAPDAEVVVRRGADGVLVVRGDGEVALEPLADDHPIARGLFAPAEVTAAADVGVRAARLPAQPDPVLLVRAVEWVATGDVSEEPCVPNALAPWEARVGWRLLFDGVSTAGWRGFGRDTFPEQGWTVADGALHHTRRGGDLVTTETFGDFELRFQWRVAPGANSGVKYRFAERGAYPVGAEYQLLDDAAHADGARAETSAGALYDVCAPPAEKPLRPAGEWNRARIVAVGDRLEHWLNGTRIVALDVGSPRWDALVADSKFARVPGWARVVPSALALQDHGDDVWFRDLKLRDPGAPPGARVVLFDGETLDGWRTLGGASFSVVDGELVGEATDLARNSFLVTERTFADFVLELELRNDVPCNSGVQVRSRVEGETVIGYQIEVDPSERAWSGGLYDEARRGWLYDLSADPQARAAFRPGEWNRYRIECVGPSIRTWVNGVPATRFADPWDAEGVIALQVHGGKQARLRWRDLRLWEL